MTTNTILHRLSAVAAIAACALVSPAAVLAQDSYPSHPIRLILPANPGGSLDITTRLVVPYLEQKLGQPIVVENKPGGDTLIGTNEAKAAAPDGYTLLAASNSITGIPILKPDSGFDPLADVIPIGVMSRSPLILVTGITDSYKTLEEFIQKAGDGSFTYAGAKGGVIHQAGAAFLKAAGLEMLLIPYPGNGAALPDVVAGRVNMIMDAIPSSAGFLEAGQLQALAVSSDERMASLPDVPTFKEKGIDYTFTLWLAFFAPADTPPEVTEKLNAALAEALEDSALKARLEEMGVDPTPQSLDEAATYFEEQVTSTRELMAGLDVAP